MADVVRLSIVYETQQAASRLNDLNGKLGGVHTSSRKVAVAALNLVQAMETGSLSAGALGNRLALLGGKLGAVGLGLAVVAGILLLWKRNADKARDAAFAFADQLRDTKRAVDDLLRGDLRPPLLTEIEKITDAITKLDRQLAIERSGGLWDLLKGAAGGLGHVLANPGKFLKRLWFGGAKAATLQARADEQAQLDRLTPEALQADQRSRSSHTFERAAAFGKLTGITRADAFSELIKISEDNLKKLIEFGINPLGEEAVLSGQAIYKLKEALRQTERAARLFESGLQTMADAIEEFVITGTLAFTDFLNNIIRLFYRDFTGELIHNLVRSVYGGRPSTIPGGGGGGGTQVLGDPGAGGGITGNLATNVTFNVTAIDAQGVAQFFDQNGAQIAATVARHADRSRAIRRRFLRG